MKPLLTSVALAAALLTNLAVPHANAACSAKTIKTMQIAQLQSKSGQATLGTGGTQTTPNSSTASGYKGTSDGGNATFRRPPEDIITIPDDPAELCCQIGGCGCGGDD